MQVIFTKPGQNIVSYKLDLKPSATVTRSTSLPKAVRELRSFVCPVCEFQARNGTGLAVHARKHQEKSFNPNLDQ